ncbi:hypothetical protein [Bradyrhizobium ottawaense]|uniref:hypothetical protein n=1 Tax=Bradyrhizobium ottawaense TaxID=931866 RepID=UPI001FE1CA42|nr:hypothetical protein [Bradyrhizobium ottawaense]
MNNSSALIVASVLAFGPAMAQQAPPNQNLQNEADKGIKTQNSGASGSEVRNLLEQVRTRPVNPAPLALQLPPARRTQAPG